MRRFICLLFLAPLVLPAQSLAGMEAVVTTDLGTFRFEFESEKSPKHVEQFVKLVREGFYNNKTFTYAVPLGIIEGGAPPAKDPKLPNEVSELKHVRGTVSAFDGGQFMVCASPQPSFDGNYTAFGRVTEGIDVVEKISKAPPPVRILTLTIEKKREEPFATASLDELSKTVALNTTLGVIRIRTEPEWAPNHVRSFLGLVASGWYDGTPFHRIAKGFVVQGGIRSTPHYADRWVHPLKAEFRTDVKHIRGVVSMAHGEDPDSATTSFFLMLGPAESLDGKFTAFARITQGLDVLDAFEKEEVDGETPKRKLEIISAFVEGKD
jgi:cyclophilin family peptidyl-prolyl cis-trans isomerase